MSSLANKYALSNVKKKPFYISNGKTIQFVQEFTVMVGAGGVGNLDYPFLVDMCIDSLGILHMTYRRGSDHNGTNNGHIMYRRSLDDGATWSSEFILRDASPSTHIATNPRIFMGPNDRVIAMYFWNNGFFDNYIRYSDDHGVTWSEQLYVEVESNLAYQNPGGQLSGACGAMLAKDGSLYLPMYGTPDRLNQSRREGRLYRSTDSGFTYTFVAKPWNSGAVNLDWEENGLVERADKLLVLLARSDDGNRTDWIVSPDGGVTWSPLGNTAFPSKGKPGICISPNQTIMVTGRHFEPPFRNIIGWSNDGGKTWEWDYSDTGRGAHMYGKPVWSNRANCFIVAYSYVINPESFENPALFTDPCAIVCQHWNEVDI